MCVCVRAMDTHFVNAAQGDQGRIFEAAPPPPLPPPPPSTTKNSTTICNRCKVITAAIATCLSTRRMLHAKDHLAWKVETGVLERR